MISAMYQVQRPSRSSFVPLRHLSYHVREWGTPRPQQLPLFMVHGWMDVSASFQFVIDALEQDRHIIAPDWRGYGLTHPGEVDNFWFPDYLADLDALIDHFQPEGPIDLLGHSMGGNVVMQYAGIRPTRIRRLINLEGFGMPRTRPEQAPARLARWLDELKTPQSLRDYDTAQDITARLLSNDPLLTPDKAAWLSTHWARHGADGRWHILGDAAHKRVNPVLYRVDETLECWKLITAPLLWVEGDRTDLKAWWGTHFSKEEFHERLSVVKKVRKATLSPSGHMLHHDQPMALAELLSDFLAH
jgi:pimeloyl-ACP methyl ester carboxylesterase